MCYDFASESSKCVLNRYGVVRLFSIFSRQCPSFKLSFKWDSVKYNVGVPLNTNNPDLDVEVSGRSPSPAPYPHSLCNTSVVWLLRHRTVYPGASDVADVVEAPWNTLAPAPFRFSRTTWHRVTMIVDVTTIGPHCLIHPSLCQTSDSSHLILPLVVLLKLSHRLLLIYRLQIPALAITNISPSNTFIGFY